MSLYLIKWMYEFADLIYLAKSINSFL